MPDTGRHRRLYLDESGDHTLQSASTPARRYLGIVGVALSLEAADALHERLEAFKTKHIPSYDPRRPFPLHRAEVRYRKPPYTFLVDSEKRRVFDKDWLEIVSLTKFRLIGVVIDKHACATREYWANTHPYHYGLECMLERYAGMLRYWGVRGDVLAESRGGAEDRRLKAEYERFHALGTRLTRSEVLQATLTSRRLKLAQKMTNDAGLQLADLLAHPVARDVLAAYGRNPTPAGEFTSELLDILEGKYNRHEVTGRIEGYGRKLCE